jgi:alkylation response protein AidB-like acyl-CoA dehydrogenase
MDFSYSEEHEAVRELAARILGDRSTHERLKALEAEAGVEGPVDRELWAAMAEAGLLGIALPEDAGGAGLDFVAEALVVEAIGRTAAAVPYVPTVVGAGGALAAFGTDAQKAEWLPRIAGGEVVLTVALAELVGDLIVPAVESVTTTATEGADGGWTLRGTKACVAAGLYADALLIPAVLGGTNGGGDALGVFVVGRGTPGITLEAQTTTSGRTEALVELDGVAVGAGALLGGPSADGSAIVRAVADRETAALCIQEAGACAAALQLVSEYTKTREQFGKPIATFQAVGQRAADAYVDTEAIRLTAWQAAWRISEQLPSTAELAVAKFWAADGGQRVVHAAVHLHGGVGVDRDYPLHRYFLMTRQIELTLGNGADSLRRLGSVLAAEPA